MKNKRHYKSDRPNHILNDRIKGDKIRLISDDREAEIMDLDKAREIAKSEGLDLMLVTGKADLPVVRMCDYNKFLYKEKKKKEEEIKKQKENNKPLKEIRLSPNISEHDLEVKKNKMIQFLDDGHKVKLDMRFKGRMIVNNKKVGEEVLLKTAVELEEHGTAEGLPSMKGRAMTMVLNPIKK